MSFFTFLSQALKRFDPFKVTPRFNFMDLMFKTKAKRFNLTMSRDIFTLQCIPRIDSYILTETNESKDIKLFCE